MKIVADDQIPFLDDFFSSCDEMCRLPGNQLQAADLKDADLLLVRTVTQVNAQLLQNTSVRFVGSLASGTDHIDTEWLRKNNIAFAAATGANALAVAEYLICVLAALKKQKRLEGKRVAGIIGCGRIGRLSAAILQALGFDVLCHDPLLTEKLPFAFVSLEDLLKKSDIVSIHTPLTKMGQHPTFHLLDESRLKLLSPDAIIVNTARGSVIDQTALFGRFTVCLDVWENEPEISKQLLQHALIATPHIAGYSIEAKHRATQMIADSAADFFGWPVLTQNASSMRCIDDLALFLQSGNWHEKALKIYHPLAHTQAFKEAALHDRSEIKIESAFQAMRTAYPLRQCLC